MSAYLRSASWALEVLRPMQGHSAPPATSTTHQLVAQPRKVRLSFRERSTGVENGAHRDWRFATTAALLGVVTQIFGQNLTERFPYVRVLERIVRFLHFFSEPGECINRVARSRSREIFIFGVLGQNM